MKVAIVLNTSWNIYNFRMGLVRYLIKSGHEVIAIAPSDPFTDQIIQAGCRFVNLTMDSRGVNPVKDMALTFELYKIYKREKPDIILHFTIKPNIYGTIAARMLRIPVINNVSGLGTVFLWSNYASVLALWMYKIAFRSANFVFFQNEHDRSHFLKKVGINGLKTGILPGSGINPELFKPNGRVRGEDFTFLMIARLLIDKGIEEFVQAVRIMKKNGVKARFVVLGNIEAHHKRGIHPDRVREWIDEGVIDYRGTTNDIGLFISQSDCVVLPSYREGTPRTLLEGASMGKPLIATNVPGCNSVVIDGHNGFLCEVKSAMDLASKMSAMVELPAEKIIEMGSNSRKLVEKSFDEQIVIDKYGEAIDYVFDTRMLNKDLPGQKSVHSRAATINL